MAINQSNLAAQDITQNYAVAIKMLASKPDTNEYFETPIAPNILYGYYNDAYDYVELYITDTSGRRYVKVK